MITDTKRSVDVALKGVGGYHKFTFEAMGSPCEVIFEEPLRKRAEGFKEAVLSWVSEFEAKCSVYRPDSIVSEINVQAGNDWVDLDSDMQELVALCDWFHWNTQSIFDPTAGPVLKLWDYKKKPFVPPDEDAIREALNYVGWTRVEKDEGRIRLPESGMSISFGGIGKEYAVDKTVKIANELGLKNVLVNYGHDVRVCGVPPQGGHWLIGLEDPNEPGRCWTTAALNQGAVCSSGGYLRYAEFDGVKYGHIIDTRTAYPVDNECQTVHVVAQTCTEAGVLSTAAFILGPSDGIEMLDKLYGTEGAIYAGINIYETRGFRAYGTAERAI